MGKKFLLIFWISLTLICTACTNQKTKQPYVAVSMRAAPRSLDPREARLLPDITLVKHLYEGLVEEGVNGDINLALAQSYTVSEDGKTYTFKLKPTFWSNGEILKAQDFILSWNEIVTQKIVSIYDFAFNHIQNIHEIREGTLSLDNIGFSCLSDDTIEIKLQTPISYFLKLLALPVFYPIYQQQGENHASAQVTNGAFYLDKSKDKMGMCLQKNPFYHKKEFVNLPKIHIYFIPDPNTASSFFNQKMIHWQGPPWGGGIPQEKLMYLNSTKELRTANIAGTSWLIFNKESYPFQNQKLRTALSLTIDKELLVTPLLFNAQPAYHLLPELLHNYPQLAYQSKQERENQAKQLFKEALLELNLSIKDLEQHPILFSISSQTNALLAHIIREQWTNVLGFSPAIVGKEFAVLQSELNKKHFSLAIAGWISDFSDPMTFLSIFSSSSGLPVYALDDQISSQLIDNIQIETDIKKRSELISSVSLYLEQLHIVEPLYHEVFHFASSENLSNFHLSSTGIADLRFAQMLY